MLKLVKTVHFIGVAMFVGSIFAHIAAGMAPEVTTNPAAMLFARQTIATATLYVTLPGLAIAAVSGLFMTIYGKFGFFRRRWLTLHQLAALVIAANALVMLVPIGRNAVTTSAAAAIAAGSGTAGALAALMAREHAFGAVNIVLAFAAIFLAAGKPNLGQPSR